MAKKSEIQKTVSTERLDETPRVTIGKPDSQWTFSTKVKMPDFLTNFRDARSLIDSTGTQIGTAIGTLDQVDAALSKLSDKTVDTVQPSLDSKLTRSLAPIKAELALLKSQLEPLGDSLRHVEDFIRKDAILLTNSIEISGRLNSIESQLPSIMARLEKLETDKDRNWNKGATVAWILVTVVGVIVAYYVGLRK